MSTQHTISIGNPVDTWWNQARDTIDPCLDLLANYPAAPDAQTAMEILPLVRRTHQQIKRIDVPQKAQRINEALLETLNQLDLSLQHQAVHDMNATKRAHNVAYHQYMMVCYYLLQRGIYEPEPTEYRQSRAG